MAKGDIVAFETESEEDRIQRIREMEQAEYALAYAAATKALASYRWWGWTNIISTVRMWITGVKIRLGMKLWP
jgi:hypothetical protein